jgi:hypothetical protein
MLSWASLGLAVQPAQAETASDSAKTVTAAAYDPDVATSPTPGLRVTVSQTNDLIQQGIKVSWTGGVKSTAPTGETGGANFLQIAQCWGDEAGSNGTRPDRTTCQYGGLDVASDQRFGYRNSADEVDPKDLAYSAIGSTFFDPTLTAVPFVSATGTTVKYIENGKVVPDPPDLDNNEFFNKYTTNEVAWAGTGADGSGSVSFELQTNQQSPGLGCGTPVTATDGTVTGKPCWLVIIPRGEKDASNVAIKQSGLFWETWKHHLAVRLNFKPVGQHCSLGAAERQLSGSELISGAVSQWQPKLCNTAGGAVYSLLTGPESDAALAANGTTAAPLAITSRSLAVDGVTDKLAYAPIGLTGVSIAFAIDHRANAGREVPAEVAAKERLAFTSMKLTPRLLAKLLSASYTDALPQASDKSHLSSVRNLTTDPDFLAINDPEWAYMGIASVGVSDVLMPLGRSDAAQAVWTYIMADADARDFLAGTADPWGMHVNPYYSTSAAFNKNHVPLELPRNDFPKADPTEFAGLASHDYADVVNLVTWRPFTSSLDAGGYDVLRGDPLQLGAWDPIATPPKFSKGDRALVGLQAVAGLTDTASAAKYQVVQASLRNPAGAFVAPTSASLSAAAAAMTKNKSQSQVVGFDPTSAAAKKATAAYPLAMPVYAAVNPAMDGAELRADYAAFITYAVNGGQTPGTNDGQLPDGYAPLPAAWKTQAIAAAKAIKNGAWPTTPSPSPSPSGVPTNRSTTTTTTQPTAGQPTNPAPSGAPSGALNGKATPDDPKVGAFTAVVPGTAALGLAAALSVPLISRFRGRRP